MFASERQNGKRSCLIDHGGDVEQRWGMDPCSVDEYGRKARVLAPMEGDAARVTALAVAFDHVLGEEILQYRKPDEWSVTSELTIDLLPVEGAGRGSHVVGVSDVAISASGGFARGTATDDAGRAVAMATTWTSFIDLGGDSKRRMDDLSTSGRPHAPTPIGDEGDLSSWLGLATVPGGIAMNLTERWTNMLGTLHGGVWAALACSAGQQAAGAAQSLSSIRLHYLRAARLPGRVHCLAEPQHVGRTTSVVEVIGNDEDGRVAVRGTLGYRAR